MHKKNSVHGSGGRMLDLYIDTDDRTARYTCHAIRQHQDSRPRQGLKYPDSSTLLSDRSKYGIIAAETVRFRRTTMRWQDYAGLCGDMLHDMTLRGYNQGKMMKRARKAAAIAATFYGQTTGQRIMQETVHVMEQRLVRTRWTRQRRTQRRRRRAR
jgi:hypothetical protein